MGHLGVFILADMVYFVPVAINVQNDCCLSKSPSSSISSFKMIILADMTHFVPVVINVQHSCCLLCFLNLLVIQQVHSK